MEQRNNENTCFEIRITWISLAGFIHKIIPIIVKTFGIKSSLPRTPTLLLHSLSSSFNSLIVTLFTFAFIHCSFSTESLFQLYTSSVTPQNFCEFHIASHLLVLDRCPVAGLVQISLFVAIWIYFSLFTAKDLPNQDIRFLRIF